MAGVSVVSTSSAGPSASSSESSPADASMSASGAEGSTSTSVSSETAVSSGVTAASPSRESSTGSTSTGVSVGEVGSRSSTGFSSAVICSSFVLIRCVPFGFGVRPGFQKQAAGKRNRSACQPIRRWARSGVEVTVVDLRTIAQKSRYSAGMRQLRAAPLS